MYLLIWLLSLIVHVLAEPSTNERIIGGQEAYAGQFPWIAAIYLTTSTGNYFCSGSLVTYQHILTAGQCVDRAISFTVLLGTHQLQGNNQTVRLATERYYLHPDYNPTTLDNDIGIIKLRAKIPFTEYIHSIDLYFYETPSGTTTKAMGWGQLSDNEDGLVNTLNWATLRALSIDECKVFYGDQITTNMLCAIGNFNEGTCVGDSGSPLIEQMKTLNFVSGISSFVSSYGCESTFPSGYTRVYNYRDWVGSITILID